MRRTSSMPSIVQLDLTVPAVNFACPYVFPVRSWRKIGEGGPGVGETKTLLRIGALALMWGSSFFWIKLGLGMFSPVQLVLARLVLGAVMLLLLCKLQRARLPRDRRGGGDPARAAVFHHTPPLLLFALGGTA